MGPLSHAILVLGIRPCHLLSPPVPEDSHSFTRQPRLRSEHGLLSCRESLRGPASSQRSVLTLEIPHEPHELRWCQDPHPVQLPKPHTCDPDSSLPHLPRPNPRSTD